VGFADHAPDAASPRIRVVAGLILQRGRFLVARRPADDPLGPVWEFPGGKVEAGEDLPAALIRELAEELGARFEVGDLVESVRHDYPHRSVELFFFRCRLESGEPRGRDGQEIRWVAAHALSALPFPAADARLIARLPGLARDWESQGR